VRVNLETRRSPRRGRVFGGLGAGEPGVGRRKSESLTAGSFSCFEGAVGFPGGVRTCRFPGRAALRVRQSRPALGPGRRGPWEGDAGPVR